MIRKIGCVIAVAAQVTAAGRLPSSLTRSVFPATQPAAPVHTLAATELPLDLRGATGDQAKWLETFQTPLGKFDYTMQLIEDEDGVQVYRLTFPSPFDSPFPENNSVPCEYYVPKTHDGKMAAAVVLDIMYGNAVVPRGMARGLAAQGVAALYMPMAYYNGRRPKNNAHLKWLEANPTRAVDPIRQTVMDVRRAKAVLTGRDEVDPSRIGITGVSLGGIMTSLAAGVDGGFYRVVPILAGGDLPTMLFHAHETRKLREALLARGIDHDKLETLMASVEPLHFANRLDPARVLMINASNDEVIPRACTNVLWEAASRPPIVWIPSGHYGAAWYLLTIKQTAIDFLSGRPAKRATD